jgi:hypothetical protein
VELVNVKECGIGVRLAMAVVAECSLRSCGADSTADEVILDVRPSMNAARAGNH